jgi:hypothetical protein
MPAATSIAIFASSQSSVAAMQAREAQKLACNSFVHQYDAQAATDAQMQQYAECVNLLHPQDLSDGAVLLIKLTIVVTLAGGAYGYYRATKEPYTDSTDRVMYTLAGLFMACLGGLFAALGFLFS